MPIMPCPNPCTTPRDMACCRRRPTVPNQTHAYISGRAHRRSARQRRRSRSPCSWPQSPARPWACRWRTPLPSAQSRAACRQTCRHAHQALMKHVLPGTIPATWLPYRQSIHSQRLSKRGSALAATHCAQRMESPNVSGRFESRKLLIGAEKLKDLCQPLCLCLPGRVSYYG